jgi:hypothetical protein
MGTWMLELSSWKCWHKGSRRRMGEVQEIQKKNERMAKQLEEKHKQLANQVEKTFYEES